MRHFVQGTLITIIIFGSSYLAYSFLMSNLERSPSPIYSATPHLLVTVVDPSTIGGENVQRSVYAINSATGESIQVGREPYEYRGFYDGELIFENEHEGKFYSYDFVGEGYDLLNFPTRRVDKDIYEELYIIPNAYDGGVILRVLTYSFADREPGIGGGREARDIKDYLYSFSDDSFREAVEIEEAKNLVSQVAGVSEEVLLLKSFSNKNRLAVFQVAAFEGGYGCADIFSVNIDDGKVTKRFDVNRETGGIDCLLVDQKHTSGAYVEEVEENNLSIKLVSLDNISEPLRTIELAETVNNYECGDAHPGNLVDVSLAGWMASEEAIIADIRCNVGETHIVAVDFTSGEVRDLYLDSTYGGSYTLWGRRVVVDDSGLIAFADYYSAEYVECARGKVCPSLNDENDRDKIIIVDAGDGSRDVYMDNNFFKQVIGWISL